MKYKYRVWLHGLVAAILNGISNSAVVVMVDPVQFNLFQGGARQLGIVAAASAVFAFFTYLKTHPLPDPDKDTDYTKVTEAAVAKIQGTGDGGTGDGNMPRSLGVLLAIGLSLGAMSCAGGLHLQPLPPAPATVADTEVRSYTAKAIKVLDSIGDVTADLSRVERELHDKGSISDALHVQLRRGITNVARAGLQALDLLDAGVTSWSQVKVLIDPLIADLNRLIALLNDAPGTVKSALGGFVEQLTTSFSEALFRGAR